MPITEIGSSGTPGPPLDLIGSRSDVMSQADFLEMLIAQLTNQDPLSPMEGTEFTAQLAQLSSLEELQKMSGYLNSSLEANLLLATSINNSMATTLIGKTIRAESDAIELGESGDTDIHFTLGSAAAEVRVDIVDEDGEVVRTLSTSNLPAGENTMLWDGRDDAGNRVGAGTYTVRVTANDAEGTSVSAIPFVEGQVTGVLYRDGVAILTVGSREFALGDIIAVLDEDPE